MSDLFAPDEGWHVRILDLSGGAQDNIVEEVGGFDTLMQANAFARRYVRDSVERCRVPGMTAKEVLEAWFVTGVRSIHAASMSMTTMSEASSEVRHARL